MHQPFTFKALRETYSLPIGLTWLTIEGASVWPLMGVDGSVCGTSLAYIIETMPEFNGCFGREGLHEQDGGRWYSLEIPWFATMNDVHKLVDAAVAELEAN